MRLYNLFLVLLLCMTVGMFSACTGDDGEAGPPGPAGPPGDSGASVEDIQEAVEEIVEEPTAFYNFLKSWGSETGEIACSDPLLTGMGPLPGEGMMKPLATVEGRADTNNLAVDVPRTGGTNAGDCSDSFFEDIDPDTTDTAALIFIKTMGLEPKTEDPVEVPKGDFNPPHKLTVTKEFVGGTVRADLVTTGGTDEPIQRGYLYNDCGIGSAPSAINGDWSAVKITESREIYEVTQGTQLGSAAVTTITKICVRLDSHPGAVKCYERTVAPDATTPAVGDVVATEKIALYDGEKLTTVLSNEQLSVATATTSTATAGIFVTNAGTSEDGATTTTVETGTYDIPRVERLCSLFTEGTVKP